jgi:uncharacterized protein (DUF2147 family)
MKNLIFLFALLISVSSFGQSGSAQIVGEWKTIDDETGKPKSIVEIFEKEGKFYGKIKKLFREPDEDPDPVCDDCDEDDPRYMKRVIGMEIIQEMEYDAKDNEYGDGTILDPANGNVYDCELWIDEDTGNLRVRGYILFLYRTQTWLPNE